MLDAWREAHWSLRLELQRIAHQPGVQRIESLYDAARRADNALHEFYRARTEAFRRQGRDDMAIASGSAPRLAERALIARFRAMNHEDRSRLLQVAVQLASLRTNATPRR